MVSKFRPTKFGNRNVFLCESHVPSPTNMVPELYELVPGADRPEFDDIVTVFGIRNLI